MNTVVENYSHTLGITFMQKVYLWMLAGLGFTASVAFLLYSQFETNPSLLSTVSGLILPVVLLEFGLVIWLSARISTMSVRKAGILFMTYSGLNGLFFSVILASVATDIVFLTFLSTSLTFGAMALFGQYTKQDLSSYGSMAYMGLIGLIIASVVNIFLASEPLFWFINYFGLLVFIVLTAHKQQELKKFANLAHLNNQPVDTYAVHGALSLYLSFINIFIFILRIFSGSRD